MSEQPPQVRLIYFTGIITAIEKQMRRLESDLESAQHELDKARAEVKEGAAKPAGPDRQS